MSKETLRREGDEGGEKGILLGDGSTANYPALLLLLAGGILGGFSVHDALNHGSRYIAFLVAALLCALASLVLVMVVGRKR
jgi:hypothetical protein